jgi:hypothetical protein
MRDLDALLNSMVNVDRASLVAILSARGGSSPTISKFSSPAHRFATRQAKRGNEACRPDRTDFVILQAWRHGPGDAPG